MKKILKNKSLKIAVTVLTLVLFIACLIPTQSVFAEASANVRGGTRTENGSSSRNVVSNNRSSEKFTVIYHPNGGSGQTYEESVDANSEYTIKNQGYTRQYFVFSVWNTRPDGLGINYTIDQIVNITENITLYACWGRKM